MRSSDLDNRFQKPQEVKVINNTGEFDSGINTLHKMVSYICDEKYDGHMDTLDWILTTPSTKPTAVIKSLYSNNQGLIISVYGQPTNCHKKYKDSVIFHH